MEGALSTSSKDLPVGLPAWRAGGGEQWRRARTRRHTPPTAARLLPAAVHVKTRVRARPSLSFLLLSTSYPALPPPLSSSPHAPSFAALRHPTLPTPHSFTHFLTCHFPLIFPRSHLFNLKMRFTQASLLALSSSVLLASAAPSRGRRDLTAELDVLSCGVSSPGFIGFVTPFRCSQPDIAPPFSFFCCSPLLRLLLSCDGGVDCQAWQDPQLPCGVGPFGPRGQPLR